MPKRITSETPRLRTIQCRVSDEEYIEIERKADKLGLSVGSYLRLVCLLADINVSIKPQSGDDN